MLDAKRKSLAGILAEIVNEANPKTPLEHQLCRRAATLTLLAEKYEKALMLGVVVYRPVVGKLQFP